MKGPEKGKLNPRKVFWQCGTCSRAMFHLLNHEFDRPREAEEKASDLLAGGINMKGHQCGMLWGAALGVGAESFRRHDDESEVIASAVTASRHLVDSFVARTGSVNCRDITRVDWENKFDFAVYMVKTVMQGFVYSHCFNLMVKWTPEAIQSAGRGLSEKAVRNQPCMSCATEVVKKMGAGAEESLMVAGFAGGIGLSGNACGALSAAIWYRMLGWGRNHPGKTPDIFKNKDAKMIISSFLTRTGSEMLCSKISGKRFITMDEHSEYVRNGGCGTLIESLAG